MKVDILIVCRFLLPPWCLGRALPDVFRVQGPKKISIIVYEFQAGGTFCAFSLVTHDVIFFINQWDGVNYSARFKFTLMAL